MQTPLEHLMNQFAGAGRVIWIGIRPQRKAELVAVDGALLDPDYGLLSDHYASRAGKRQVTLVQAEHLPVIAGLLHRDSVAPGQLRRNIVVAGINLLALKDKSFQLGEAVLEFTGLCHPCSRMEQTLGRGGYNALRGHGGITARVTQAGKVQIGDACRAVDQAHLE